MSVLCFDVFCLVLDMIPIVAVTAQNIPKYICNVPAPRLLMNALRSRSVGRGLDWGSKGC